MKTLLLFLALFFLTSCGAWRKFYWSLEHKNSRRTVYQKHWQSGSIKKYKTKKEKF